ncbi:hypothetical protein MOF7_26605 [Methylobacterium oryzae]
MPSPSSSRRSPAPCCSCPRTSARPASTPSGSSAGSGADGAAPDRAVRSGGASTTTRTRCRLDRLRPKPGGAPRAGRKPRPGGAGR